MPTLPQQIPLLASALILSACTQSPGEISRDTQPFDGIAEDVNISLVGNEPFWNIEIAPDGDGDGEGYSAVYSTPDNIDGAQFPVSRFAGNNGLGFNGELDGGIVQIAITPGDCSDTMSDRTYPYSATVALGARTLYGCGYTSDEPFTGDEAP